MVLLAFIIYFVVVLGIGFYFYKRSQSMEDYILGARQMNPYVTAMSAQASDMSSWLLMGLPGAVLLYGIGEAWIGIGLAIGSYLSWLFVAKKLRKHSVVAGNALTLPEFFSNRYKDEKGILRIVASVIILFFFVIYVASGFKGCGVILTTIFPEITFVVAMVVGAIIIIAYTFMGGFKAVCWTDFFQAILMVIAVVIVPLATMGNLGGWGEISATLDSIGADFMNIFADGGKPLSLIAIISLMAWAFGYFGMPHIVVRYMSIRNPEEVKVARRVSLIWIVIALTAAIMIGVVGRAYVMKNGLMDGPDFNAEHIFVYLAGDLFAPLIAGLLFAAIMAAIMSTADSQLLVASSSIVNDLLGKSKWADGLADKGKTLMWISRGVIILVAIVALALAAFGSDTIMGLVSFAWAGFGAAFGPLVILSLYWKRMTYQGAVASMMTGFILTIVWNSCFNSPVLFSSALIYNTGIYELLPGFIIALLVGVLVSLVTPEPDAQIQKEFDDAQTYTEN